LTNLIYHGAGDVTKMKGRKKNERSAGGNHEDFKRNAMKGPLKRLAEGRIEMLSIRREKSGKLSRDQQRKKNHPTNYNQRRVPQVNVKKESVGYAWIKTNARGKNLRELVSWKSQFAVRCR